MSPITRIVANNRRFSQGNHRDGCKLWGFHRLQVLSESGYCRHNNYSVALDPFATANLPAFSTFPPNALFIFHTIVLNSLPTCLRRRNGSSSLHQQTQRIYTRGHFSRGRGFETFGQPQARRNCAGGDESLSFNGLFVAPEAFGVTKLPSL